jgi:hypothetical protein
MARSQSSVGKHGFGGMVELAACGVRHFRLEFLPATTAAEMRRVLLAAQQAISAKP